ncbi:MAG: hypothetical protein L7W43_08115 [Rubripirellula sp.]|nr:hypothetical protein [Rhodopirellula sp.]MCH1439606.1 hypothetical protein [Rubripirellula sp.]OUX05747.1 MAG: hypothetical protein CBE00_09460 [Planctomycetaceae bacterium TMED240]
MRRISLLVAAAGHLRITLQNKCFHGWAVNLKPKSLSSRESSNDQLFQQAGKATDFGVLSLSVLWMVLINCSPQSGTTHPQTG